jgi:hypothetical protein
MSSYYRTSRQRYRGYREAEPLQQQLDLWRHGSQQLADQLDGLAQRTYGLPNSTLAWSLAQLWGERPIWGRIGSVSTTTTLTVIHDPESGYWTGSELTGGLAFFAGQPGLYSVVSTMASCFAVLATGLDQVRPGGSYWVERTLPLIAQWQSARLSG